MTRVFIITALGLSCFHRQRRDHFAHQLHRQFIEADNWQPFIVRQAIEMQEVFHPRQVFARYLSDTPGAPTVWLELVFFSTTLTVSWEILSQKPSSTALSANNRSVQRACPVGAFEQAKAVILARAGPSILGGFPV